MIEILLNGKKTKFENQLTITQLIERYQLDIKKIAVEKNLEIIEPSKFSQITIDQGCVIEIIHFIGGG